MAEFNFLGLGGTCPPGTDFTVSSLGTKAAFCRTLFFPVCLNPLQSIPSRNMEVSPTSPHPAHDHTFLGPTKIWPKFCSRSQPELQSFLNFRDYITSVNPLWNIYGGGNFSVNVTKSMKRLEIPSSKIPSVIPTDYCYNKCLYSLLELLIYNSSIQI